MADTLLGNLSINAVAVVDLDSVGLKKKKKKKKGLRNASILSFLSYLMK